MAVSARAAAVPAAGIPQPASHAVAIAALESKTCWHLRPRKQPWRLQSRRAVRPAGWQSSEGDSARRRPRPLPASGCSRADRRRPAGISSKSVDGELDFAAGGQPQESALGRSTVTSAASSARPQRKALASVASSTMIGSRPFLRQLPLKDIGKRSADDGAETKTHQRPGRVLARAAAAEVVAGQQHCGALRPRLVEDEVRASGLALRVVAPVVEQVFAEPLFVDRFQKPRRDDLVGIDVAHGQRDKPSGESFDRFHKYSV